MQNINIILALFNRERRFRINIEKDSWRKGTLASKIKGGIGAGIYCTELDLRQPFKLRDSIFQAEELASNLRGQPTNNQSFKLVWHIGQKCQGSSRECRQNQATSLPLGARSHVIVGNENVINTEKLKHCLYGDLNRSMARKIKTR